MSKTINLQERWYPRLINYLFHIYIMSKITNNKLSIKTKEIEFILQKCKTEYNNNKSYYDNEFANITINNKDIFNDDNDNIKIKKLYTLLYIIIFIHNNINEVKIQYITYITNIINTENLIDKTMLNDFKIKKSENYLYYITGFGIAGLLIGAGYIFGFKNIKLPLIIKN